MKKFRALLHLTGKQACYYMEATNTHEATVAAQRQSVVNFGQPKEGEDLDVHEWDPGKRSWVYAEWPTNCDNPFGLPCSCGGKQENVKFISKEEAEK